VRSKKDIFDLGKKVTMEKGEMYRYVLCEKPLFNEAENSKTMRS